VFFPRLQSCEDEGFPVASCSIDAVEKCHHVMKLQLQQGSHGGGHNEQAAIAASLDALLLNPRVTRFAVDEYDAMRSTVALSKAAVEKQAAAAKRRTDAAGAFAPPLGLGLGGGSVAAGAGNAAGEGKRRVALIAVDSDDDDADDDGSVASAMAAAAAVAQPSVDSDVDSEDGGSDGDEDEVDLTAAAAPKPKPKPKGSNGELNLLRIGDVDVGSRGDGLSLRVHPHHRAIKLVFEDGERLLLFKFESIARFVAPAAARAGSDDDDAPPAAAAAAAESQGSVDVKSGKEAKEEARPETLLSFDVVRAPWFQAKNDDSKLSESADFTTDGAASIRTRYSIEFASASALQEARAALGRSQRLAALMLAPVSSSTEPRKFDAQAYAANARAERPDLLMPLAEFAAATAAKAKDARQKITSKKWPRVCFRCRRTFNVGHSHWTCFEPLPKAQPKPAASQARLRSVGEEKKQDGFAAASAGAGAAPVKEDGAAPRPQKLRRVQSGSSIAAGAAGGARADKGGGAAADSDGEPPPASASVSSSSSQRPPRGQKRKRKGQ